MNGAYTLLISCLADMDSLTAHGDDYANTSGLGQMPGLYESDLTLGLLIVIASLTALQIVWNFRNKNPDITFRKRAMSTLNKCYTKGEISKDNFERLKKEIEEQYHAGGTRDDG